MSAKVLPQYLAAISVCLGAWGFGTVLGWSGNITDDLQDGKLNDLKMDTEELSWAGSCCTLGAMVMCLPIGFVADWIGRKPTCLLTTIPFTIGWLLIIFARSVYMVYVGRFLTGAAGGSFVVIAPLYTTEIAQTYIRGTLGSLLQLFIIIGSLHGFILGWALSMTLFNVSNLVVPVVFGIVFFFQPESPFYYIKKGNAEGAARSFERLRGKDYDFTEEQSNMTREIDSQKILKDFRSTIKLKSSKKATLVCFGLMFFQQASGINCVFFYIKDIFIKAQAGCAPHVGVISSCLVALIGIIIGVWTIDYFGRTILLMTSMFGCSVGAFFLAVYFTLKDHLDEEAIRKWGFLPLASLFLFVFAFNLGLGALPFLACSEIFSPELKAKLASPAAAFNWFLAFLVTKFYFPVSEVVGVDVTFYVFSSVSLVGFFFVLLIVPETKNKTYEQIIPDLEKFWKF